MKCFRKRIVAICMALLVLCTTLPQPVRAQGVAAAAYQVEQVYPSTHGLRSYAQVMAKADYYEQLEPYEVPREEMGYYIAYKVFTYTESIDFTNCNYTADEIDGWLGYPRLIARWNTHGSTPIRIYDENHKLRMVKLMYTTVNRMAEMKSLEEKRVLSLGEGVNSDIAKALVIHDFVCKETRYYGGAERTIFNVAFNKNAQCDGYSQLYAYYMNLVGVPCEYISGDTTEGYHAWNRVYLDGQWYLVDTTWDDTTSYATKYTGVGHRYFLKSGSSFSTNHTVGDDLQRCHDGQFANAFWTKADSAYRAHGDYIIYPDRYNDQNVLRRHHLGTDPIEQPGKVICNINPDWSNRNGRAVDDNYCTPVFYNGRMYYNTPWRVVSCDLDGNDQRTLIDIWSPITGQPSLKSNERIFSLEIRDGTLLIKTARNSDDWLEGTYTQHTYVIDQNNPHVKPERIISTKTDSLIVAAGETNKEYFPYHPEKIATVSSLDPSICEIDAEGFRVGKKPGKTTLVITTPETEDYAASRKEIQVEVTGKSTINIAKNGYLTVEGEQPFQYTGNPICPTVRVDNVYNITENDYEVRYENNVEPGRGKVIVTAKGEGYTGTLTASFLISKQGEEPTPTATPTPTPTPTPVTALDSVATEFSVYDYTGSAIVPKITVMDSSGNEVPSSGYQVTYTNNTNEGTATVTVVGTGSYTGSVNTTFRIEKKDLSKGQLGLSGTSFPYTGLEIRPVVTVRDASGAEVPSTDYDVEYSDNVNVGQATVTVRGKGICKGELSATFTIVTKDIGGGSLELSGTSFIYTGSAITPTVTVKDASGAEVPSTDYDVAYSNNVNAGQATVTVTGKGSYAGSLSATFAIEKKQLATLQLSGAPYIYTGSAITPTVTVKDTSGAEVPSTGYDVAYSNNVNVGQATVTVIGKGNYTGSLSATFAIEKKQLATLQLSGTSFIYTGSAITPTVTVKDASGAEVPSTDYDVAYSNNVNVGQATVTVTGKGSYTGRLSTTFTIERKRLAALQLSGTSFPYTGSEIRPTVTVKDASGAEVPSTGYNVAYSNNVNAGQATVTVTGKDNYTGTLSATFAITPQSGGTVVVPPVNPNPSDDTITATVQKSGNGTYRVTLMRNGQVVNAAEKGVSVTIPLDGSQAISGHVLLLVEDNGQEKILRTSIVEGNAIKVKLTRSGTVKVAERSIPFQDVQGHWAKNAIDFVSSRGLFLGVDGTTFSANTDMNRAMLVTVLHRLEDTPAATGTGFPDVATGQWYSDAVFWASGIGIVNGTGSGFRPNDAVSREQIAAILYRYGAWLGIETTKRGSLDRFRDSGEVSGWALEAMQWAVEAGIIGGISDGALAPKAQASRAEVATMLMRFVGLMNA